ncbi:unnamed protein product, partial [marine sediment metagenome]
MVFLNLALFAAENLASYVMLSINEANILEEMGIEILSIAFTSIKATPEISNALEADYRESLQRKERIVGHVMAQIDNIVIVTKKTWLEDLIMKYNTKSQAKFYIESMG